MAEAIGAGRVGIRISPMHHVQGMHETDEADVRATYGPLVDQLKPLGLAYLSVLHAEPAGELVQELRARFGGPLVANSGFGTVTTRDEAVALIDAAHADAVAVGRAVIANPDLVRALGRRAPGERAERGDLLRCRAPRATPTTRSWPPAELATAYRRRAWPGPRATSLN